MNNFQILKEQAAACFRKKDIEEAAGLYKEALNVLMQSMEGQRTQSVVTTDGDSAPNEENILNKEAAKLSTNISLMMYKLGSMSDSKDFALKALSFDKSWMKGYLRCVQAFMGLGDTKLAVENMMTFMFLADSDEKTSPEVLLVLQKLKFYTHREVLEAQPSWGLVKYPDNVYYLDCDGAGHMKDLSEIIDCIKSRDTSSQASVTAEGVFQHISCVSILVSPGIYKVAALFENCTIDIVGNYDYTISPGAAVSEDPPVLFQNYLTYRNPSPCALYFVKSTVSLSRLTVKDVYDFDASHVLFCSSGTLQCNQCSLQSLKHPAVAGVGGAKLSLQCCRFVNSFSAVILSNEGTYAKLKNCFIDGCTEFAIGCGDPCQDGLKLKHCVVSNCRKPAVLAYGNIKLEGCTFDNLSTDHTLARNASDMAGLVLNSKKLSMINCKVQNIKCDPGIAVRSGRGKIENVEIKNTATGIFANGQLLIKSCSFCDICDSGIVCSVPDALKRVVLDDNVFEKCGVDVGYLEGFPAPTLLRGMKPRVVMLPKESVIQNSMMYLADEKKRKKEKEDDTSKAKHAICEFCHVSEAQKTRKFDRCSNCKIAKYCCRNCQAKDWKRHKPFCDMVLKEKLALKR